MIEPNDLYRRMAQEGQELHDKIDRLEAEINRWRILANDTSPKLLQAKADLDARLARCTALDAEIARIESEKAAYRTLAELDKASLVERDERISHLCGELAASRLDVQTNWDEGIEVIATHIEHLRDEFQSTAMPVKSVATAVRERFASPFAEKLDLDYLKSQAVIADNVPRLLQDLARANKEIERQRLRIIDLARQEPISDMQIEHHAADRDKLRWLIVAEPDGTYTVKEFTIDGVAPPTNYPTAEQAVARLMQMARVRGPVYSQTWPERVQVGTIETTDNTERTNEPHE